MIDYHLTATYIPANISDGIRWRHFTQFQHGVASKTIFLDSCDISKLDPFSKNLMIIFLDPTVKIVWTNLNFQFLLEKMPSKNQQDLFLKFAWSRNQCLLFKTLKTFTWILILKCNILILISDVYFISNPV